MAQELDRDSTGDRRLVLGFDGGCSMCSDLAGRIKAAVGDKLEVRSLHDPQFAHWRKQTLGEDAPWTPTLVAIKDGRVTAWVGAGLGLALGRRLGPTATWRVLQALGEVTSASEVSSPEPAKSGIDRRQFLKAFGGLAAAIPLLSLGSVASPAVARSASAGTPRQQQQVAQMVRDSKQYKGLAEKLGKPLDFTSANFEISEEHSLASLAARTESPTGAAAMALFFVDLRTGSVQYHRYAILLPENGGDEAIIDVRNVDIVAYENGRIIDRVSLDDKSIVTSDGRRTDVKQYLAEAKERQRKTDSGDTVEHISALSTCRPGYTRCKRNRFKFCYYSVNGLCYFARYFGIGGQIACWLYPNKRSGC